MWKNGEDAMSDRKPLVSVTADDFELQTFRAGGNGGQGQNKRSTGVRLIHKASGARGEARDQRSFDQNRKNAFIRLTQTETFKNWLKIETARALGQQVDIEERVKRAMNPKNIRTEVKDENGRWVEDGNSEG
jgi:protein subunit release factor B